MKKLLLLLAFIIVAGMAEAQDVIFTKKSEQIEAQIIEISDEVVRYKRMDNLEGPVFVISTANITSIVFANGELQRFNEQELIGIPPESMTESNSQNILPQEMPEEEFSITLNTGREITYRSGVQLEVENGKIYYGGFKFEKDKEYKDFLKQTCPAAYQEYRKAEKYAIASQFPAWIGVGLMGYSVYQLWKPLITGTIEDVVNDKAFLRSIFIPAGLGVGSFYIALSLMIKSTAISDDARAIFNTNCVQHPAKKDQTYVSFDFAPMGVGFTINF